MPDPYEDIVLRLRSLEADVEAATPPVDPADIIARARGRKASPWPGARTGPGTFRTALIAAVLVLAVVLPWSLVHSFADRAPIKPAGRGGAATVTLVRVMSGSRYKFKGAGDFAADGGDMFLVNSALNSVTEFSASSGDLVRVISGSRYKFNGSSAIAADGGDLFVANVGGESVTEFSASTGDLVRVISGSE
jgi:hypothetical protein